MVRGVVPVVVRVAVSKAGVMRMDMRRGRALCDRTDPRPAAAGGARNGNMLRAMKEGMRQV